MRYLMLIYGDYATVGEPNQEVMEGYNAFTKEVTDRGVMLGGEALHPTSAATTVRVRDGKVLTTDGPFAETKEQLGGFYLLKCQNLDEAIELATKVPDVNSGSIEIRPIMEWG